MKCDAVEIDIFEAQFVFWNFPNSRKWNLIFVLRHRDKNKGLYCIRQFNGAVLKSTVLELLMSSHNKPKLSCFPSKK
jgi:hypothetical protein